MISKFVNKYDSEKKLIIKICIMAQKYQAVLDPENRKPFHKKKINVSLTTRNQ